MYDLSFLHTTQTTVTPKLVVNTIDNTTKVLVNFNLVLLDDS